MYDAEFSGAGGDRIRAWYLRAAGANEQTPVVVKFIGYGGGRGLAVLHLTFRQAGRAPAAARVDRVELVHQPVQVP